MPCRIRNPTSPPLRGIGKTHENSFKNTWCSKINQVQNCNCISIKEIAKILYINSAGLLYSYAVNCMNFNVYISIIYYITIYFLFLTHCYPKYKKVRKLSESTLQKADFSKHGSPVFMRKYMFSQKEKVNRERKIENWIGR